MRHAVAALLVTLAVALAACSGDEVTAEGDAVAGDTAETESSDTETPTQPQAAPTPQPSTRPRLQAARVARVIDGDTLETADGRRIRLVQIDAPESSGECYGAQATAALEALLPAGSRIGLERDPELDDVDRYGRQLRYVFKGRRNLNIVLVRRGAASVWFFDGDRGRYADRLLATARAAKARKRGAWGACRAQLDPTGGFETVAKARPGAGGNRDRVHVRLQPVPADHRRSRLRGSPGAGEGARGHKRRRSVPPRQRRQRLRL